MAQILCFGDSITQGYTDEFGGWTQRMRRYLDSRYTTRYGDAFVPTHDVFNLGVSGATSQHIVQRFKQEIMPRLLGKETIIIISIGTNDGVWRENDNNVDCSPENFTRNLMLLISQGREFTNSIILVGLLPCEEKKMQPMPWSTTGKSYSNKNLRTYNDIIEDSAKREGLSFADLYDQVLKNPSHYLADGLHPNEEGHTLIAYEVQHLVEQLLKR